MCSGVVSGSVNGLALCGSESAAENAHPTDPPPIGDVVGLLLEILRMVVVGRANRDIASQLVISEKTVRNHIEHIYAKTGVTNRVSASLFALSHGITRAT